MLALIDDATQEQRLTLWAIDVLKYGEPFSTPLRQFYLPSTSQADATKQALGVVVAIGSHPAPSVPHAAESPVAALLQLLLLYKGDDSLHVCIVLLVAKHLHTTLLNNGRIHAVLGKWDGGGEPWCCYQCAHAECSRPALARCCCCCRRRCSCSTRSAVATRSDVPSDVSRGRGRRRSIIRRNIPQSKRASWRRGSSDRWRQGSSDRWRRGSSDCPQHRASACKCQHKRHNRRWRSSSRSTETSAATSAATRSCRYAVYLLY